MKKAILINNINEYIVRNKQKEWQPLIEKGIHYEGISVIPLHYDESKDRSTTILLKFEPELPIHIIIIPAGKKSLY